jgi:hypothetical protein
VELDAGPYHVEGALHATPAAEPFGAALRRAAWVPLTEVTVTYHRSADDIREDVATLIVNRDWACSFREVKEDRGRALPQTRETAPPDASCAIEAIGTVGNESTSGSAAFELVPVSRPPR